MSLRARLVGLILLMNLLVLGVIQATAVAVQSRFLAQETQSHLDILQRDYGYIILAGLPIYSPEIENTKIVRRIFQRGGFRDKFRDILISAGHVEAKRIHLNPLGCAQRDHATFPMTEVLAGIRQAIDEQRLVSAAGGRCVPIKSESGEVSGGAWFVPIFPSEPRLTFADYAVPIVLSMVLFGVLVSWIIGRTLVPPLTQLGDAARRVESGDYGARVPAIAAPELRPVADAFNAMATKVEGHTEELKSEVRRATEEAAAKERAMVVSARLASMGTLAAGVAHEINNPIGGMLNAVHRLGKTPGRSEQERRYLELIQQGLERVAQTSRRLLGFTPRTLDPVEFSLSACVEAARALVEHRIVQQGVTFRADSPADLPALWGEPNEIQQVLLNLFLNSLNAMQGMPDRHLTVRARATSAGVRLDVEDDGPGVDAAMLGRVMDPFFSGSNAPDSTGLGLFISFTIVQNHGGTMAVESRPGAGFRVRIDLPRRAWEPAPRDPEPREPAPPEPEPPAGDAGGP